MKVHIQRNTEKQFEMKTTVLMIHNFIHAPFVQINENPYLFKENVKYSSSLLLIADYFNYCMILYCYPCVYYGYK